MPEAQGWVEKGEETHKDPSLMTPSATEIDAHFEQLLNELPTSRKPHLALRLPDAGILNFQGHTDYDFLSFLVLSALMAVSHCCDHSVEKQLKSQEQVEVYFIPNSYLGFVELEFFICQ